jgi:histone H3/H4
MPELIEEESVREILRDEMRITPEAIEKFEEEFASMVEDAEERAFRNGRVTVFEQDV